MPKAFWVLTGLSLVVFGALHLEWRRHRRALAGIPIRVHVNGTRGKSSVTRLVAAILRAHGVRTVAKTTGTSARLILPDGSERPVHRDGPPNIRELIRTIHAAAGMGAEAVVFECMAVDPALQRTAERSIVQPTITIVTNARLDHTDIQGANETDIARAFAVRPGGTLVTADPLVLRMQEPSLAASGGSAHLASGDDLDPLVLRHMSYLEHPDNVAVALEMARLLGIPFETAEAALTTADPDPGMASVLDVPDESGPWTLVNLFAANDPDSTFRALETVESVFGDVGRPVLVFASRRDRIARSVEFADSLVEHHRDRFSTLVVWGERTRVLANLALRRGMAPEDVLDAGDIPPDELTQLVVHELGSGRTAVGVGNIVGPAHRWLESLAARIEASEALTPGAVAL
jgi:poly-gamma-glutamate synthase PgsB/CapB